jgi:phosphotriesterase-related protein
MVRPTRTVLGDPIGEDYDLVLAHEHLLIDLECWLDREHELYEHLRAERVRPAVIDLVRQHPFACPDNVVLDDVALAVRELTEIPDDVRVLVVDVTPETVGRDPVRLAEISRRAGVDVVTGCGPYIEASWDRPLAESSGHVATAIQALFGDQLAPAVIGEIGTSSPVTPAERVALTGAARAQAVLGVPLYVHVDPWSPCAEEALDIIEAAGGDLGRTVICHMDILASRDPSAVVALLERDCRVAIDIWGDEDAYGGTPMPTDAERVAATLELIGRGFADRLVHSQDVCTKSQLRSFGGPGYGHLWRVVRPLLLEAGLTPAQVRQQLAGNTLSLLCGDE